MGEGRANTPSSRSIYRRLTGPTQAMVHVTYDATDGEYRHLART